MKTRQFVERHGLARRERLLYLWDRKRLPSDWEWEDYDQWTPGEPSTIRTTLKVAEKPSSIPPAEYSSYEYLRPGQRRRYLDWLAAEELDPEAPEGYANLYYLGLERRCFGALRNEAWKEILDLRRAFGEAYLLQVFSEQVLAASAVADSDWRGLAGLVEEGAFDAAPLELKSLLISYLSAEGMLDWRRKTGGAEAESGVARLPLNWLAEAARIELDSAAFREPGGGGEFVLPCFEAEVEEVFRRRSLAERLDGADAGLRAAELELRAANRSIPFPGVKPLKYLPILASPQLIGELTDAWTNATQLAAVYEREQGDVAEEEQAVLAAQQLLLFDWRTYDVGLALRRAGRLLRSGDHDGAKRLLEELLRRREPNQRQRGSIKRYLEKCRLARG